MDRRKRREFVPSGEDLEERKLLNAPRAVNNNNNNLNNGLLNNQGFSSLVGGYYTTPSLTYSTLAQKEVRIKHLPLFLRSIEDHRFLEPTTVASLQADLSSVRGVLTSPKPYDLNKFNVLLRNILTHASLSTADIASLNTSFGAVLADAGVPATGIAEFQTQMTNLTRVDAQGPNPVYVATNDYAIVLQLALGIGRPIDTPTAPHLLAADRLKGRAASVTANPQPRLTGTYDPGTTIKLFTLQGQFLGQTDVPASKSNAVQPYTIAPDIAFAPGRYQFVVQGTDASGELSAVSPAVTISIVAPTHGPHPKGPLR